MDEDENHEAYGAMVYRQLHEQRTLNVNKEKEALDVAIKALAEIGWWKGIGPEGSNDFEMALLSIEAIGRIKKILK